MSDKRPIIIIKKKGGHGGHHGGAWKVAYADFVTAMMALFIVLWLLNTSSKVQKAVGGYFKDPTGTSKLVGTNQSGSGDALPMKKDDLAKIKEVLENKIRENTDLEKLRKNIEMTVTAEGLRIEMLESEKDTFFDSGSATPTKSCKELLEILAKQLGEMPNKISMEGHTDSRPFSRAGNYGNWELSTDRANAARRLMQAEGIKPDQISQVRGYADQRLRKPDKPEDASNRRISLIVQYLVKNAEPEEEVGKDGEHTSKEGGEHGGEHKEGAAKEGEHGGEHKEAPAKEGEHAKPSPAKEGEKH
jgi:chemotaxis protein MotB